VANLKALRQGQTNRRGTAEVELGLLPRLISYTLRQAQGMVDHEFHAACGRESIRAAQFPILEVIHRNPGIRPSKISNALGISRANLVPLLAELEAGGALLRRADESDGRAQALRLTARGAAKLKRLQRSVMSLDDGLAAMLGPQGRETLLVLLQNLLHGASSA
jgi:DNA-binding MarR family transcriptional regulator